MIKKCWLSVGGIALAVLVLGAASVWADTLDVHPLELDVKNTATAQWSGTQFNDGSVSAHLNTTGAVGAGDEGRIVVPLAAGTTLNDLATISWFQYVVAGYSPHVDVIVDTTGDGIGDDALVVEYAYNGHEGEGQPTYGTLYGAWYQTFSDDGNGPTEIDDTAYAWLTTGPAGGPDIIGGTLAEWKAGTVANDPKDVDGNTPVLRLEIEVDNWMAQTEAYIDTIAVNGTVWFGVIQDAIDEAIAGDTIDVAAGTYNEDVAVDKANLELHGAGPTTIIQGLAQRPFGEWPNATANIDVRGAGVELHDFTFRNPDWVDGFYSSGMIVGATNVDIHDVDFIGPTSDDTDDLSQCFQTWNTVDISGLDLHDNTFTTDGAEAWGYEAVYINTGGVGEVRIRSNTMQGKLFRGISTVRENVAIEGNTIVTTADPANAWAGIDVDANNVRVQNNVIEGASGFGIGIDVGATGMALQDIELFGNDIGPGNDTGIRVRGNLIDTSVYVRFCNIVGNVTSGIDASALTGGDLDAEQNWWGADSGPTHAGNAGGAGDVSSDNVDYDPWLQSTVEGSVTVTIPAGGTLDARAELGLEVDVAGAAVDVTVAGYTDNPGGAGFGTNAGFFDVFVPDVTGVTEIKVRFYYPDTIGPPAEANLKASYWDGANWVECSIQALNTTNVNGYGGFIEVTITATTIPTLNDLTGTIFGSGWTQPASVFWYEDFEYTDQAAMEAVGWVFGTNSEQLWHLTTEAAVPSLAYPNLVAFPSSDHAVWFANPNQGSYGSSVGSASVSPEVRGQRTRIQPKGAGQGYPYGELTSPEIDVSGQTSVKVSFDYYREVECYPQGTYDKTYTQVSFDGGPWQTIWSRDSQDYWWESEIDVWIPASIDGIPLWGEYWIPVGVPSGAANMKIRFVFDAVDNVANDYLGWLIDDLKVSSAGPAGLRFEEEALPEGLVGQAYSTTIHAVGGTALETYAWRVISNTASSWLTVHTGTTTASLSGTPTTAGSYQLCIGVSDDRGETTSLCYDIIIEQMVSGGNLFYDDFETVDGWTADGLWHRTENTPCVSPPYASPTHVYYYGNDATCNYATAGANSGELMSPAIDVSSIAAGSQLTIGWKYWREVESYNDTFDQSRVEYKFDNQSTWTPIWYDDSKQNQPMGGWHLVEATTDTAGNNIVVVAGAVNLQVRFVFNTVDGYANQYTGWLIDDVKVIQQVEEVGTLAITSVCGDLPDGTVGTAYSAQLTATGGILPYTWTWTAGQIPGLAINSATGAITGTPTADATYTLCEFQVEDAPGSLATLGPCSVVIDPAPACPCNLAALDFTSDLTDQILSADWTATGLWHVADNGCAAACLGTDKYAYFGQDATCGFDTGGTVTGYLTSPAIALDACITAIAIGFDQFREVETYATGSYDRSSVEVRWNTGTWGAWTTVWTKDSNDASPDCDPGVGIGGIGVPGSVTQVQVRFGFDSVDALFNQYIGWALDDIWVKNDDCVGPLTAPMSAYEAKTEGEDRLGFDIVNIPNPVRDVDTTTFSVRGVGVEAIKVQIFDLNQSLIYEEEISGTDLVWHTVNSYGEYLANGVYFYRALVLRGGVWSVTGFEKLIILR